MKAIINSTYIFPLTQIEEGYLDYLVQNNETSFTYSVILRIPYKEKYFQTLNNLKESNTIIDSIVVQNDVDENITVNSESLIIKQIFHTVSNSVNQIIVRLYRNNE